MSIKTYKHDDKVQITPHFNSSEFKCKCGEPHDFNVNDALVEKLETLFSALDCSKIIVTSGYRCEKHDKNVGGSGKGQHTIGNAADICCYDKAGNIISSKNVCCKAQDIGFTGIANINTSYNYTHADVRTGSKWYGDETKGNNTVTSDFYEYFNIKKDVTKGIDVSKYQGTIDWEKVKGDGIKFAILRAGFGKLITQKDPKFEEYYNGAKSVGLPVGAYWYSYATSVEEAKQEAKTLLEVIKGKQFEYPIYYDVEEMDQFNLGKEVVSNIIKAFLEEVESAGYYVGLYMSTSYLNNFVNDDVKKRYTIWCAHYNVDAPGYKDCGIWQYSCKGKINGITGDVDLDEAYKDYPTIIKNVGLNGFSTITQPTETEQPTPAPVEETQIDVTVTVDGKEYTGKLTKKE